jgi:nucleotide-binding universal stress UspA family protein
MFPFKRVLVALDLSELDDKLIQYALFLTTVIDIDKLYFFHVARTLDLPEELIEKYPDLLAPADESIEHVINEKIKLHFKNKTNLSIQIEVREGNAEDKILRWTDIKEIDLMIMGRKQELNGSGLLPGRIAKTGHCSLLMVPENSEIALKKIMVPVDFSKSSLVALNEAKTLAEKTHAKIILQNTYTVPWGYHTTGKTYEEFSEIMKEHARNHALEFIEKTNLKAPDFEIALSLDEDDMPADKIIQEAVDHKCNLILLASKGRTGLASLLLGSVADKILQTKSDVPVLIIKDRKTNLGFLEALWRL